MNPLGLFPEPPGPLLTHLHTVYMAYSERLPTRLNPLAERTCFSQVWPHGIPRAASFDLALEAEVARAAALVLVRGDVQRVVEVPERNRPAQPGVSSA